MYFRHDLEPRDTLVVATNLSVLKCSHTSTHSPFFLLELSSYAMQFASCSQTPTQSVSALPSVIEIMSGFTFDFGSIRAGRQHAFRVTKSQDVSPSDGSSPARLIVLNGHTSHTLFFTCSFALHRGVGVGTGVGKGVGTGVGAGVGTGVGKGVGGGVGAGVGAGVGQ